MSALFENFVGDWEWVVCKKKKKKKLTNLETDLWCQILFVSYLSIALVQTLNNTNTTDETKTASNHKISSAYNLSLVKKKNCLRGMRPGKIQTGLRSYRS